jgi:hypothetical protein
MKSTKSALRWLTLSTALLLAINLTACSSVKRVEVVSKPVDRTKLNISSPDPLKLGTFKWVVITPQNAEEVFAQMQSRGENLVLFAIDDAGYKQLSMSIADIRNFINSQRNVIVKYKEYYEPNPTQR